MRWLICESGSMRWELIRIRRVCRLGIHRKRLGSLRSCRLRVQGRSIGRWRVRRLRDYSKRDQISLRRRYDWLRRIRSDDRRSRRPRFFDLDVDDAPRRKGTFDSLKQSLGNAISKFKMFQSVTTLQHADQKLGLPLFDSGVSKTQSDKAFPNEDQARR